MSRATGRLWRLSATAECFYSGFHDLNRSPACLSVPRLQPAWHISATTQRLRNSNCLAGSRQLAAQQRCYSAFGLQSTGQTKHSNSTKTSDPTIYALSTAPGRAAIAIIRLSGPACLDVYRALCPKRDDPKPRYATLRTLYDVPGEDREVLDSNALVLYFPAPRTVTGEDVLEFHVHGGPAVVKAALSAISRCYTASHGNGSSIRYAEPGEFTRRAFLNDRLDLTQVEALDDTLSATTEQQRRLSVRGTTGILAKQYESWRTQLLYARGELEALIDFSEDQHFDESPAELCASVSDQIKVLKMMLQVHSQNAMRGELLRNGISISLLGAPNAGKSSLLNRIVGREAAIVSQEAGTTRDVVEIGLDIGGYLCRLGDTAGLRKALLPSSESVPDEKDRVIGLTPHNRIGEVEQEGMRRAKARAAESDVVLVVLSFEQHGKDTHLHLDPEVIGTASQLQAGKDNIIVLLNKVDLATSAQHAAAIQATLTSIPGLNADRIHLISCKQDVSGPSSNSNSSHESATSTPVSASAAAGTADPGNVQAFLNALIEHFVLLTAASTPDGTSDPSIWQESLGASERHRVLLERCIEALDAFLLEVAPNTERAAGQDGGGTGEREADIVVAAEHLRSAGECLAKITGRGEAGDVEEVLGVVFEKFCVGK